MNQSGCSTNSQVVWPKLVDHYNVLTPEDGAPSVPAIQLVLGVTRPGKLYKLFTSYIDRGLGSAG